MTWMTLGHGLKALDAMNNLGLWMIWAILGRKLKVMDVINNSMVRPQLVFFFIQSSNRSYQQYL